MNEVVDHFYGYLLGEKNFYKSHSQHGGIDLFCATEWRADVRAMLGDLVQDETQSALVRVDVCYEK